MRNDHQGRTAFVAICVAIATFATTLPAHATEPFAQTGYVGTFLRFPRGVRNLGMGSTGAAAMDEFTTGYYNPASYAWIDGTTLTGSSYDWVENLTMSEVRGSSSYRINDAWGLGGSIGYGHMDSPEFENRTVFLPNGTGQQFRAEDYYVSTGVGIAWERNWLAIGAGVTGRYVHQEIVSTTFSYWTMDLGAIVAAPVRTEAFTLRPRVGVSVTGLNGDIDTGNGRSGEVEDTNRFGFGFDLATPARHRFLGQREVSLAIVSFDYDIVDGEDGYAAGMEFSLFQTVQLRYGVNDNRFFPDRTGVTYGLGAGWDFDTFLFQIDYAHFTSDTRYPNPIYELDQDVLGASVGGRFW